MITYVLATVCCMLTIIMLWLYFRLNRRVEICISGRKTLEGYKALVSLKRKPRRRYIVLQAVSLQEQSKIGSSHDAVKLLGKAFKEIVGELGMASMGFTIIDYNPLTHRYIVRAYHHRLREVLGVIGIINTRGMKVSVITITGSIRKARHYLGKKS
ncbi:MAG: Rpp14/Pop5 family protein [Desulfurococcales archaeon]|nr:Rpp14/Pop5 family protein [Desulfurococcales archaeon]